MTVDQVLQKAREYMTREAERIEYGELTFNVSVHRNDLRKLNFASTETVRHNPYDTQEDGRRYENSKR